MKCAIIAPSKLLKSYATQGDLHFILSSLVEVDSVYTSFYSQQKKYKIIFNDKNLSSFDLLYCASLIGANEIILPDVLGNGEETYKKTTQFLNSLDSYVDKNKFSAQMAPYVKNLKFMGIPQGEKGNLQEYISCLYAMLENPKIHTIGISTLACSNILAPDVGFKDGFCPMSSSRKYLLDVLSSLGIFTKAKKLKKQFHLLGTGAYFEDLILANQLGVRSNDTASPVFYGLQNIGYRNKGLVLGRQKESFDFQAEYNLTKKLDQRIRKNIKIYKNIVA